MIRTAAVLALAALTGASGGPPPDAPAPSSAAGVPLTRDGTRAYTSNVHGGTVSVIDLREKKVLAVIAVSSIAQRIALSVADRWVFTADQAEPRLAVIDTATNRVKQYVPCRASPTGRPPRPTGGGSSWRSSRRTRSASSTWRRCGS